MWSNVELWQDVDDVEPFSVFLPICLTPLFSSDYVDELDY